MAKVTRTTATAAAITTTAAATTKTATAESTSAATTTAESTTSAATTTTATKAGRLCHSSRSQQSNGHQDRDTEKCLLLAHAHNLSQLSWHCNNNSLLQCMIDFNLSSLCRDSAMVANLSSTATTSAASSTATTSAASAAATTSASCSAATATTKATATKRAAATLQSL